MKTMNKILIILVSLFFILSCTQIFAWDAVGCPNFWKVGQGYACCGKPKSGPAWGSSLWIPNSKSEAPAGICASAASSTNEGNCNRSTPVRGGGKLPDDCKP